MQTTKKLKRFLSKRLYLIYSLCLISIPLGLFSCSQRNFKSTNLTVKDQYNEKQKQDLKAYKKNNGLVPPDYKPEVKPTSSSNSKSKKTFNTSTETVGKDGSETLISLDATTDYNPQKCDDFKNKLPKTWIQESIKVPENYNSPNGTQITVFYYYEPLKSEDIPVVFFNGGPFSNSWSSYTTMNQALGLYTGWSALKFIYIDQRGTGCSSPPPLTLSDIDVQRSSHYGSKEIVLDAEMIRKKILGTKKWKVFGQSYGAHVVHRYAIDAPEFVISFHAHGNAITSSAKDRFYWRVKSQYEVLQKYYKVFPSDEEKLKVLVENLNLNFCVESKQSKQKVCGLKIISSLAGSLGFYNSLIKIHKWVSLMVQNNDINTDAIADFAEKNIFIEGNDTNKSSAYSAVSSVVAKVDRGMLLTTYDECSEALARLKKEENISDNYYISECNASLQTAIKGTGFTKNVDQLPTDLMTVQQFKNSITKNSSKFYLYSGEKDPYTPKYYYTEEVQAMGKLITYKNFLDTGHDGYFQEPEVLNQILIDK